MKVIKSDGKEQSFNTKKIERAITNANKSVEENQKMTAEQISEVVDDVMKRLEGFNSISTEDINDFVEIALTEHNYFYVLKAYQKKREEKRSADEFTLNEKKVIALIEGDSELRGENANKNIDDNGAVSDYIAGILTKSINNKIILQEIIDADKKGLIHWHDKDYSPLRRLHNCDLLNAEDMLNNSFQMMNARIEPNEETPFRTICNLLAQINLIVSGRQYGGQTISWAHTLPFIDITRRLIRNTIIEDFKEEGITLSEERLKYKTEKKLRKEVYEGVKTYQYQILSHSSANGQTPFVSNNLCLREAQTQQELDDFAILIEEIFKRRIKGIKDESGHYVTPLFPKLLYWTCDGLNVNDDDKYFYLTKLAALCEIKRTQPDIVSEKETRRVKEGQIIPSMGCRSLLAPIWEEHTYPISSKFYWVKGKGHYPYSTFIDSKTFEEVPNGEYKSGYEDGEYQVNFRGNTGWLIKKTDTEVTIYEPKVYGRWNNGVITINLPHVGLEARAKVHKSMSKDTTPSVDEIKDKFYSILDKRLELCRKALKIRYEYCSKIKGKNSKILWVYGGLARMGSEDTVGDLMKKYPKRASISLGFVGLFETCMAVIGESNTTENGIKFSMEVLNYLNKRCNEWKEEDNINYSIYGTPEESLTYKFATANRKDFGVIDKITDKDYVVNSYHVDPRENIDCFTKLEIEGKYLALSSGGAVSYVETLDLSDNPKAIITIIRWMNDHIVYSEFNRKIGICYKCGYEGDIDLVKTEDGKFVFRCPHCGNEDDRYLDVTARLCGYLGKVNAGNTNKGRLDDIYHRVIHTDCKSELELILKEAFE